MQIAYHYLKLREFYGDAEKEPVEVTLEQLAEVLCCTRRNVKLIVKQCQELGWIEWQAGRGRGNRSILTFNMASNDVISSWVRNKIDKGQYSQAMELMRKYDPDSSLHQQLTESIYKQFGIRSTSYNKGRIDLLRLPFYREMPVLDPVNATLRTELHMIGQLFDTLVEWDGSQAVFIPRLAVHWEQNRDGTEWTFYLRKGVLFHNKKELTSADVRHTLMRLGKLDSDCAHQKLDSPSCEWKILRIRSIEATHRYALRIQLDAPSSLLLHYLAAPQASVIPCRTHEYNERLPIGTGPFKLMRNDAEMVVLEAFADYYRERAQLDKIEIWILKELRTQKMPDGGLGGQPILYTHPFQIHTLAPTGTTIMEQTEGGCAFIIMNGRKQGPLLDPAKRRRLRKLLQPEKCVEELGGNRSGAAYSFFPDWSAAIAARLSVENETENAETEREAAAADTRVSLDTDDYQSSLQLYTHAILNNSLEQTARWIQQRCASAGILVHIHVLPYEQFSRPGALDAADIVLLNAITTNNREWSLMHVLLHANYGVHRFVDPVLSSELGQRYAAIARETDPAARSVLLQEVEALLLRHDALHFLYHLRQAAFYHPNLFGTEKINPYGWVDFRELSLRPE
ncbi:DNA-binding transcriptional regulator SgrR of sgrS sRNA, contains a MarR-type HTH domain and a solute-binding domain [Paenibacillus sp. UNCCL117]|uniref:ABC transporter substrate-binding protein n=1 Tax=unclassified Paenibacillus TaxID=185978 RepID=UPI000890A2F8|nr:MULTISPECIES: ABC transporter substrate-binding protein [unclassified Paenibacillus]SDD69608.1 DNA-binding transcriptional regulator SgrR of sgrS sRNA, contains a MarR-type HTH domain and a solute-binding domain [Paenibacillus sp. cl123]SFW45173.1 DNA-binding transcriptional regulator SgrR of sgrS sRNA, contains a MarR-type HTH domain and a solute-binding domain [Paenibacillus sp. UNCCL117]